MAKTRAKALPSIVYQYGCKPPDNQAAVIEQMRLANRYRNRLVEIELARRASADAIVHADELAAQRAEIQTLDERLAELFADRRRRNSEKRRKTAFTPEEKAEVAAIKEQLTPLRKAYREAKLAAYGSPANKIALAAAETASKAAAKEARRIATSEWGLYWGTYTAVEASATKFRKGVPPRFRGFRGDGQVAAQIQSNADTRLTTEEISECGGDSHFRILRIDKKHASVSILIGGADPCKRISPSNPPVYATVRATLHRPLPDGAHVSWVRLVRKKIGTSFKWFVQFILARAEGWKKPAGDGVVGIDDRFDELADGSIRIAKWHGGDGDSGELVLPADLVAKMRHKPAIQSVHDEKTEIAKKALLAWIKATKELGEASGKKPEEIFPDWWNEATKTIHAWRGASRFAGLIAKWRDNRFDGDAGIFQQMEDYRKDAKHLFNWYSHETTKALGRRKDLYRNWARMLARKYGTVGVRTKKTAPLTDVVARFAAIADFRATLKQGGLELIELPAGEGDDPAEAILRGVQCAKKEGDLSHVAAQGVTIGDELDASKG